MTKSEKIRLASRLTWFISVTLTANFFGAMVHPSTVGWLVVWGVCAVVQYGITLAEAALFDGTIPPPWRIDWMEGGPVPWIWCGSVLCLFLDVLLNIGGVAYFMRGIQDSSTNQVLQDDYGATDGFITLLRQTLIIAFSVLAAVGSELLNAYADLVEGRVRPRPARDARQDRGRQEAEVAEHDGLADRVKRMLSGGREERDEPEQDQGPRHAVKSQRLRSGKR